MHLVSHDHRTTHTQVDMDGKLAGCIVQDAYAMLQLPAAGFTHIIANRRCSPCSSKTLERLTMGYKHVCGNVLSMASWHTPGKK